MYSKCIPEEKQHFKYLENKMIVKEQGRVGD